MPRRFADSGSIVKTLLLESGGAPLHLTGMLRICALLFLVTALPLSGQAADLAGPAHVVDGDTLVVSGTRVRLQGIDAVETDQRCRSEQGVNWDCGAWVTKEVRARYEGQSVVCRGSARDRYGRLLARCSAHGRDIGTELVRAGLAFAYRRYSLDYVADEEAARTADLGLWASAVQSPEAWRHADAPATAATGCAIKGNISKNGRIYHLPGSHWYGRTGIDASKGERWFCSETEARAAGWRPAGS